MSRMLHHKPKRIWVENDHVLTEAVDGTISVMTAEVSIHISRLLGAAGADALINRVTMQGQAARRKDRSADD